MKITHLPFDGDFKVTQGEYGNFSHKNIPAMDLVGLTNKNVYSTCEGIVSYAGWENPNNTKQGFGLYVKVVDKNGNRHYYGHLASINVKVGQAVTYTTKLGVMGSTGNSTGPHTHYEIRGPQTGYISVAAYTGLPNKEGTYNSNNFMIELDPPKPKYTPGRYKVNTLDGVNVRTGPGTNYKIKGLNELSADAKRKGGYINGTVFDVLEVQGNWGRGYSGWVCLDYCKRV